MKKTILIISIIIIFLIGAFFTYNAFFKEETPITEEETEETIVIGGGETSSVQANQLSQEPVLNPVIDNNSVKYHSASNGNVFQSNLDGSNSTRISSDILTNLIKVLWSPDKAKMISFFDQAGQVQKYFHDFNEDKSTLLDANIQSLDWSPTENKIVYQYYDRQSGLNNISIANPDGSEWTNIFQTRMKDLVLEWPKADQIALQTKPSGLVQSAIYMITASGENFQKLIDNTYGLTALWSPQGDKVLYSETNSQGQNLELKLLNTNTNTSIVLNFSTLPEKCVWSGNNITIYCAVPTIIPNEAIMPDDYYKNLVEFSDIFYKVDLNTGQKLLLAKLDVNAKNLLVNEDYLIFVNKKDGLLYSLEL